MTPRTTPATYRRASKGDSRVRNATFHHDASGNIWVGVGSASASHRLMLRRPTIRSSNFLDTVATPILCLTFWADNNADALDCPQSQRRQGIGQVVEAGKSRITSQLTVTRLGGSGAKRRMPSLDGGTTSGRRCRHRNDRVPPLFDWSYCRLSDGIAGGTLGRGAREWLVVPQNVCCGLVWTVVQSGDLNGLSRQRMGSANKCR